MALAVHANNKKKYIYVLTRYICLLTELSARWFARWNIIIETKHKKIKIMNNILSIKRRKKKMRSKMQQQLLLLLYRRFAEDKMFLTTMHSWDCLWKGYLCAAISLYQYVQCKDGYISYIHYFALCMAM